MYKDVLLMSDTKKWRLYSVFSMEQKVSQTAAICRKQFIRLLSQVCLAGSSYAAFWAFTSERRALLLFR